MCYAVGGCQARCTLAYWHHPTFSSGQSGNHPEFTALWQALHEARAEAILVGHDHVYERFAPQSASGSASSTGPREFMVGTGGKNLGRFITTKPNSQKRLRSIGVLRLRLRPTDYVWKFARISDGASLDGGTGQCI
ncbi:MAG: hypothetical protein LC808_35440 [Actinobacteria bacterium]|nr:hypothetical protein [Actinomycetota bacterium]